MEVSIIKIGNSKGFILSKSLLDEYGIKDKVELILKKGHIVLKPIDKPRKGWDKAFKNVNSSKEEQLFIDDVFEDEEFEEWN